MTLSDLMIPMDAQDKTKHIRVLHVFKTYFPDTVGGIEQVIRQLSRACSAYNITSDVFTLTPGPTRTIKLDDQTVYTFHQNLDIASTAISAQALKAFGKIARHYDIIHYHYPWPFGDLLQLTLRQKKPTILTYHSDIIKQKHLLKLYRPLQTYFLKSVDRIIATSPQYAESSNTLKRFQDKVDVIPLGADASLYPPPTTDYIEKWKKKLPGTFFLFVGVLRYYKGLHILLEAIKDTNLDVVIAGSGPEEKQLKNIATSKRIHNAHFLGQISEEDKQALLTLCTAVILPSHLRSEAFGVTLLEGAIYSKPLISCELETGTTFINLNQETGLTAPPENARALQEAMLQVHNNPSLAQTMGQAARIRYEQNFTIEKISTSYVQQYNALLNH